MFSCGNSRIRSYNDSMKGSLCLGVHSRAVLPAALGRPGLRSAAWCSGTRESGMKATPNTMRAYSTEPFAWCNTLAQRIPGGGLLVIHFEPNNKPSNCWKDLSEWVPVERKLLGEWWGHTVSGGGKRCWGSPTLGLLKQRLHKLYLAEYEPSWCSEVSSGLQQHCDRQS